MQRGAVASHPPERCCHTVQLQLSAAVAFHPLTERDGFARCGRWCGSRDGSSAGAEQQLINCRCERMNIITGWWWEAECVRDVEEGDGENGKGDLRAQEWRVGEVKLN